MPYSLCTQQFKIHWKPIFCSKFTVHKDVFTKAFLFSENNKNESEFRSKIARNREVKSKDIKGIRERVLEYIRSKLRIPYPRH